MDAAHLPLGQLGLDGRPGLALCSIAKQVHDYGAPGNRVVDFEKVCAGDPAVLHGLFPRSPILANTDNHIQSVIAEVETLAMTL